VYTMGQAVAITPNGDYYAAGPVMLHDDSCYGELMGIVRSQDAGRTWQLLHRFCASDAVRIMAAPAPDGSVYVAAWWDANKQERLWRSDDGVTWTDVLSDGVDSRELRHWLLDFVINPTDPDVLFLSDYFGLIRSLDRGETWTRLRDPGPRTQSHYPPEHAYAMAFGGNGVLTIAERWGYSDAGESYIYRSDDNGDTWWRALETLPRGVSRLIVRPQSADALYAGLLDFGVYEGRANGGRWIARNRGLQTLISVKDLAASTTDVDRVYAVGNEPAGGLFRSEDGGLSWTAIMTDVRLTAIDLYPGSSDSGWAGGNGVMFSFDSENTHLYRHMPEVINAIKLYARSPHQGYLVGSSRGGGFLGRLETIVTPDSPSDFDYWSFLEIPNALRADDLAVDPRDSQTVYVAAMLRTPGDVPPETVILRSNDAGETWTQLLKADPSYNYLFRKIEIAKHPPYTLYAMQQWAYLYFSKDGGQTWDRRHLPPGNVSDMVLDDFDIPIIASDDGAFRWDAASSRWRRISPDAVRAQALLFARGRQPRLYAGTRRGVWAKDVGRARLWLPWMR